MKFSLEAEVRPGQSVEVQHGEVLVNDAAAYRSPLPGQHRRRGSHPEPGVALCSLMPQGNRIDPEGQLILGAADRKSGLRRACELEEGRVGDAVQLFREVVVGT